MCRNKPSLQRFLLSLAVPVIALALPSAARAQCQASGSIQVFPNAGTCATGVLPNGTFDIQYFVTNTSSNGVPGPAVTAVLNGTTVATLSCDNASCLGQTDPATFVPVGGTGCVAQAAGVLNCSAGGVNLANINMAPGGVALTAGGQVFLATIRVQVGANSVLGCQTRFTRVDTGPNDIATTDAQCTPQVSGGGQGSSSFRRIECVTGQVCRAANGACDVPETCNSDNTCPADGFAASTTICRASAGQCDLAESCTGGSPTCPADAFSPSTTPCTGTSNGGGCDANDSCNGTGTCVDGFSPSTTICRASAGQCDLAESCSGTSGACPANGFQPSTTPCTGTSNGGACDANDSCSGTGTCVDGFSPSTTICRASAGQCDLAESCSGTSGACPANGFSPSTTPCTGTSNGGGCDANDSCNGTGTCVDGFSPSTTICRAAAGQCDVAESCSGTSGACPANGFQPSTTACTGTSNGGACDGNDSCDGTGTCVDGVSPSTTVCRPSAGACDVPESCTGTSSSCPADGFQPSTTTCNADLCQSCPGNAASCPTTDLCGGGEGCTPGFWKNNARNKGANAWAVSPNELVDVQFDVPACIGTSPVNIAASTLAQALGFQGGETLNGAAQILMRAAVAAKLNSLSACVDYDLSQAEVVNQTNAALASCNRNTIITLAGQLDALNNAGCPLNQQGQCSHP